MHRDDDPAVWVLLPTSPDPIPYIPKAKAIPDDATPCYCAGCSEKYMAIEAAALAFASFGDVDASGSRHAEERAWTARHWQRIGWWARWRRLWWAIAIDANAMVAGDVAATPLPLPRSLPVMTPAHRLHSHETSQIAWHVDDTMRSIAGDGPIYLDSIEVWPAYDVAVERVIVDDVIVAGAGAGNTIARHTLANLGSTRDTIRAPRLDVPPFIVRRYVALAVRNDSGLPIDAVSAGLRLRVVPRPLSLHGWRRRQNGDACSCKADHPFRSPCKP